MPNRSSPLRRSRAFLPALILSAACAAPRASTLPPPDASISAAAAPAADASAASPIERVIAGAGETVGRGDPEIDGRRVPTDCSGYLRALYARAGVDLFSDGRSSDNGVRAIVRFVERRGGLFRARVPAAGDLVFFDNSYDRNGDGRLNDRFTHAGMVERVLPDGTAVIVHATNHGIVREPMNLLHPHDLTDAVGRPINSFLRRKSPGDPQRTPRLMSELFAGFGRVFEDGSVAAVQRRQGGNVPHGRTPRRAAR